MTPIQENDAGFVLNIHVQPRASKNEFAGQHGNSIKVRLKAPPVDGEANRNLLAFLAERFDLAKSNITLLSGGSGRDKRVQIECPLNRRPRLREILQQLYN